MTEIAIAVIYSVICLLAGWLTGCAVFKEAADE